MPCAFNVAIPEGVPASVPTVDIGHVVSPAPGAVTIVVVSAVEQGRPFVVALPDWPAFVASLKRVPGEARFGPRWRLRDPDIRNLFLPLGSQGNSWKQWTGGTGDVSIFHFDEVCKFIDSLLDWCRLVGKADLASTAMDVKLKMEPHAFS
mmetsp:Transcript_42491/g.117256  ORF Transcript_42491/g.117256 Transcript_42491/m.117256 type:complete len:150 (+) Transcript_42491:493-942(+)